MKHVLTPMVFIGSVLLTQTAGAAVFTGDFIGSFSNPDYDFPDVASITNNDEGRSSSSSATFSWGVCLFCGSSKFVFDGVGSDRHESGYSVDVDTPFSLGTFTYINTSVSFASSVTGVSFNLLGTLDGVGSNQFDFDLSIVNTPNLGGDVADYVEVTQNFTPISFTHIDGQVYSFEFLGFSRDNGVSFESATYASEGTKTKAMLYGRFVHAPTPAAVPVPAAIWLLLSGLASMGIFSRRSTMRS